MDQYEAVHRLVEKIQNGLPEIKARSITSIHTKVTVGILEYTLLPKFKKMPGALLNWINDNSARSELLYKVLTILSYFAKTQDGLLLLEQYQATDFFKQLRHFLLAQNPRTDVTIDAIQQYTGLLENMIKALLPLSPQTPADSELEASHIPLEQSKVQERSEMDKTSSLRGKADERGRFSRDQVQLSWVVAKDPLGKKEEDQLYGLLMELRHGKRQLHLQWFKRIHELLKYWGYKWFRFRGDLINELMDQYPKSKLKWLIIEIIRSILRGLNLNSQQFKAGQLDLINVNSSKPLPRPESQLVTISIRADLFSTIYSAPLLKDILSYQFEPNQQIIVQQWIIGLRFAYSPQFFIEAFQRLTKQSKQQLNLTQINKQIQLYAENYPQSRNAITQIIERIPVAWGLKPEDFPVLLGFLKECQKSKAYGFISKYDEGWQLGTHLHMVSEVMSNLERGVGGIDHKSKRNQLIGIYLKCLLTLGVAVEKQDPLMGYYPTMKNLIIDIAKRPETRSTFYQEILTVVNSHAPLRYGSASYITSQIAIMVFSEDSLFKKLFEQGLNHEEACGCWLQATKRFVLSNSLASLDEFANILYCLTSHKSQQIKEISRFLLEKLGKAGKMKVQLCRLFSTSEQQRRKITSELFKANGPSVLRQLDGSPPQKLMSGSKKLLKIGVETIQNYIKIILNSGLEQHIQVSAAQQLLESMQRMELNQDIIGILIDLSQNIKDVLTDPNTGLPPAIVSILVQVREVVSFRTKQSYVLPLPALVILLTSQREPKSIKILLREIYSIVFQSPFHDQPQLHFTVLLNPPLKLMEISLAEPASRLQPTTPSEKILPRELKIVSYRESRDLQHFAEGIFHQLLNNQKVVLDQIFAEMVEKQIGQIIHANKGYANLHFLLYIFQGLSQYKVELPEQISEYSAPLLQTLLSKQMPPIHSEPTAQLLRILGSKRNRQLTNLLSNGIPGTWKLFLLSSLSNVSSDVIEDCLKGLLGLHSGREAALILTTLLPHLKRVEVNKFSQSLIVTSCLKYFRQEGDYYLRKISLCTLTQLYGGINLPSSGQTELFASLTATITQQMLSSELFALSLNLAKLIVLNDNRIISQGSVLKLLLSRLTSLSSAQGTYRLLQASVLQIFRVVTCSGREDLLSGLDLIDISLLPFSLVQRATILREEDMRLLVASLDILYFSCESESDLPKYLLTSTRLQSQLLKALQISVEGQGIADFLEAISRLWIKLSTMEEDLFIYKISQLLADSSKTLMELLAAHLHEGGVEYLKMLGWTVVIWSKNRQVLNEQFGLQFSHAILASTQSHLIKLLLPFSLRAKQVFLSSPLLAEALKESTAVVEARIVKDTKERKKKGKINPLTQKETEILQKAFGLLSALFYWKGEGQIEGGEGLRKGVTFLERFYLAGAWEEDIMKHFLRVTTNMALASTLSNSIAARLSENGTFVEEIANSVIRAEAVDRSSRLGLRLAGSLLHIEPVRAQLLRARVIQQISTKMIQSSQRDELNLEYAMEAVELFLAFSTYKDANVRILGDKRLAQALVRLMGAGKLSILQEKIAKLLANLACFKHNKPTLMACKDLHKTLLGLLEDPETPYRSSLLFLLYNLLYKNSAGLKLYRRGEVVELVRSVQVREGEEVEQITVALLQALEGCEG